jgi:hypothetical protein
MALGPLKCRKHFENTPILFKQMQDGVKFPKERGQAKGDFSILNRPLVFC